MCINCQYLEFRVVSGLGCVGAKLNGILRDKFRRPTQEPPLQPAQSRLYDGYFRCLRSRIYHNAEP